MHRWCDDPYEPECIGMWCDEWGKCKASKQAMKEDPSLKEEWLEEKRKKQNGENQ